MLPPAVAEINLEPVAIDAAPTPASAPPAEEIDISNEWEDMIEVEPAETAAPELEVQSYQEISEDITQRSAAEIEPAVGASVPEVDLSAQIGDKVQEIRFYLSQQMWGQPRQPSLILLSLRLTLRKLLS